MDPTNSTHAHQVHLDAPINGLPFPRVSKNPSNDICKQTHTNSLGFDLMKCF